MEQKETCQNQCNTIEFAAVGVTFENRQNLLNELYSTSIKNGIDNIPIVLKKEPENQYDPNAIAILTNDNRSIGYVSKSINDMIGAKLSLIKRSYIKNIYMNKKRIFNAMICLEF